MSAAFEYPVVVQPHHTDYAGVVWHGTYIAWMEEARVACLRSHGVNFADWVEQGIDLPVVDLALRYRQPLTMGAEALVRAWPEPRQGVRLVWRYDIRNQQTQESCVVGTVTLVPVDRNARRLIRQLPEPWASTLNRLHTA